MHSRHQIEQLLGSAWERKRYLDVAVAQSWPSPAGWALRELRLLERHIAWLASQIEPAPTTEADREIVEMLEA